MKSKILIGSLCILVIFGLFLMAGGKPNNFQENKNQSTLALKISSDKPTYIQGEIVKLNFDVLNESDVSISLPFRPDVSTGYLGIWISFSGERFNRYNNTSWGGREGKGVVIEPGQSFKSEASVLWNSKPDISRLNEQTLRNSKEGAIFSAYAFSRPGTYSVKAILSMPNKNQPAIESAPIQITVVEPVNDDLGIWQLIKEDQEIAYFIQTGDFLSANDAEREKNVMKIEQISVDQGDGILANQLNQSLEKFRINEAKKIETLQRIKQ